MAWTGLAMLVLVGVGIATTGLPAAVVLIGVAIIGALAGLATDTIPFALLSATPARLVSLFDNDLLQALPLYVTMGLLLDRLPITSAIYRSIMALFPRNHAASLISGMTLGALLGPMNGSVGASAIGLSRIVAPRLDAESVRPEHRDALIAAASTLGVLVPPSLVLILLSDAMLSAHTFAVTETGRSDRVVNTQDIFHAALMPAGILLVLFLIVSWWLGRSRDTGTVAPPDKLRGREIGLAVVTLTALVALLGGVATGYFLAVEAAAVGAFALLVGGLVSRELRGPALRAVLRDAIAISGALFTLLLAATTFTLILRLLGTDRLVKDLIVAIPGNEFVVVAVVLGIIGLCAFVLDAFEIIFVIVPIVIPPLLVRVADARWVSVLVLLTLQLSFLLPPFGYALMMVRGAIRRPAPFGRFLRALMPFLICQSLLLLAVLLFPALTHFDKADTIRAIAPKTPMSDRELSKQLDNMVPLPDFSPDPPPR